MCICVYGSFATVLFISCSFIIKFCQCLDKPCYRLFTIPYQKSYRFEWDVVVEGETEGGGTCKILMDRKGWMAEQSLLLLLYSAFFLYAIFPYFYFNIVCLTNIHQCWKNNKIIENNDL